MALAISYAPQFIDNLEAILNFFDERNGSDRFSKKLLKMINKQIQLLKTMPEIGRLTDTPGVRIIFVERFGIDYQIRDKEVLIINIYSCQTDPEEKYFKEQ
jgi:Plasmid stabilisation system protein.